MEYKYIFKSNPIHTFKLTMQPFHNWAIDLYLIMQSQPFTIEDIQHSLGLNGLESMSLLSYMIHDLHCIKPIQE